jgi:hypothetical protein
MSIKLFIKFSTVTKTWHETFDSHAWTIYPVMEVLLHQIEKAERELDYRQRCIDSGLSDPGRTPYQAPENVCLDNFHHIFT